MTTAPTHLQPPMSLWPPLPPNWGLTKLAPQIAAKRCKIQRWFNCKLTESDSLSLLAMTIFCRQNRCLTYIRQRAPMLEVQMLIVSTHWDDTLFVVSESDDGLHHALSHINLLLTLSCCELVQSSYICITLPVESAPFSGAVLWGGQGVGVGPRPLWELCPPCPPPMKLVAR